MIDNRAKFFIVFCSIYKLAGGSVGLTFKPMIPTEVRGLQKIFISVGFMSQHIFIKKPNM
jgi:hypothetical protein